MIIYHGSEKIIRTPEYGFGNSSNDYGRGFYCTEDIEIAKEWACKKNTDGFANCYDLDINGLNVCDLNSDEYTILNWLALLTKYRGYWQRRSIAEDAKDYLQSEFLIDTDVFDIIIGYRADDSYFSFAQDFIMGTISLQKLSRAMKLGKLGEQIVLKSSRAFERISYNSNESAPASHYYPMKVRRDLAAREQYMDLRTNGSRLDEVYILDLMRGRVNIDDLRI